MVPVVIVSILLHHPLDNDTSHQLDCNRTHPYIMHGSLRKWGLILCYHSKASNDVQLPSLEKYNDICKYWL